MHTHPPAASALAAAEQPLVVAHMDATPLFDDTAFLPDWPGLPTADREGELIAGGLGDQARAAARAPRPARRRRGGAEAAFLAVFIERMARLQLDAAQVGGARPIDAGEARRARDFLRTDRIMDPRSTPGRGAPRAGGGAAGERRAMKAPSSAARCEAAARRDHLGQRVLFVMMMLTAVDVVGRYVLNRPVAGGFEITEMMLAALIYCGLPLVSQRREHIVIDTFDHFMSRASSAGSTCRRDRLQRIAVRHRAGWSSGAPFASPTTATRPAC